MAMTPDQNQQTKKNIMYKILSVDDEPINQAIVEELFSTIFDISLLSSGEECLQNINSIKPELILLDVSMVGMDGYETCRALKKDESTRHIPIIFVSARGTLEDKIKAYEAGGHNYMTKPFNHSELEIIIKHTIEMLKHSMTVKKQPIDTFLSPATIAINNLQDAKVLIRFLTACCSDTSIEDLKKLLLISCQDLNLNCTIQHRTEIETRIFSTESEISPLEQSLFEHLTSEERFFDFNSGTIITYPHISLLIKNMPINNTKRRNELKDLLGAIMAAAEYRIN